MRGLPDRQTPLRLVHSELSLRSLSRYECVALGAICLGALLLLGAFQYGRIFIGDEIGTLKYLKASPTYILTHFTTHLSMNYFILVEKGVAWLCGAMDWRLTLLPLAAALAIIPLTASLALKLTGSTRTALIAASLAAVNPYLVLWGPAIRAYSLLVALSLLAINEFFNWYQQREWRNGVRCAVAVLLLLLAHLNGVYTVAFLILLMAAEGISVGFSRMPKFLWESRTIWVPLAGVAIVIGIAYWRLLPDIQRVNREWGTDTPPTSIGYLPQVFTTYMGSGYASFLMVPLVLAGCWSAAREKRALLLLCGGIVLGPLLMSLQGLSVHTWTYARYLIFSLPWLLILTAAGIDWIARHVWTRTSSIVAWSLTVLVAVCWIPTNRALFIAKQQWPFAEMAKFLHAQVHKDDVIVAGWAIGFTLSQFFESPDKQIMLPDKYVDRVSNQLDSPLLGRVFYVTGRGSALGRKAPVQRFGQAEVTIYSGNTARALLQQWSEDLPYRTAGRVIPAFQGDYQLLALLEKWVPSGRSAHHWQALAERCRAQNPATRDTPRHMQTTSRAVIFP